MPGPRLSLDDYARDRIAQLHGLGGVVREANAILVGDDSATVHGWVTFGETDGGLLGVYEHVILEDDGTPHRLKYGYQCQHGDQFLFRYDRDPVQHPDMTHHKHLPPEERRVEWERVTLQDVADEFWPIVVERDEAAREIESDE